MAIPVLWRTKKARYNLQGEVCPECKHLVFPPRQVCPYCEEPSQIMCEKLEKAEKANAEQGGFTFPALNPPVLNTMAIQGAGDD